MTTPATPKGECHTPNPECSNCTYWQRRYERLLAHHKEVKQALVWFDTHLGIIKNMSADGEERARFISQMEPP